MSPNQVAKIRRFLRRMWTDLVENPITVVEKQFETAGSSHDDGFLWNYGSWRESRSGGNGQGRMRRRAAWGGGITRDGDKKQKRKESTKEKEKTLAQNQYEARRGGKHLGQKELRGGNQSVHQREHGKVEKVARQRELQSVRHSGRGTSRAWPINLYI